MKIPFSQIKIGQTFWELPDEYDMAFTTPLVKIAPVECDQTIFNARSGSAMIQFKNEEIVEVRDDVHTA